MPGAKTAIEMREDFGENPEKLPKFLQEFFDKMFQFEIENLEVNIVDLSPTTVALFRAIEGLLSAAQNTLVEKLTADNNVEQFTVGTKKGIAKDIPADMVPFVIAALTKITLISHNAHVEYENMKSQLPAMLLQLKEVLTRQAIVAHDEEIRSLEEKKTTLENLQPDVTQAALDLAHDPEQQLKIENQTSWFKRSIRDTEKKIREEKAILQAFMSKNSLFEVGASELRAPLAA